MKYKSTYLASSVLSLFGFFALTCPSANATYIATLNEVGSNVVGTGSGSIDFSDLTFDNSVPSGVSRVEADAAELRLGAIPNGISNYSGISGPTSFGSGGPFFSTLFNGSGNFVGVAGAIGWITVPTSYTSGDPLGISTATWNNATFASLGLTPGTYVWTWGSGMHADSYTLNIVAPATNGVPETGSTIALMLAAVASLIAFRGSQGANFTAGGGKR